MEAGLWASPTACVRPAAPALKPDKGGGGLLDERIPY